MFFYVWHISNKTMAKRKAAKKKCTGSRPKQHGAGIFGALASIVLPAIIGSMTKKGSGRPLR